MVGNGPNQQKQLYSAIKYLALHVCAKYLYAKRTGLQNQCILHRYDHHGTTERDAFLRERHE